MIESEIHRMSHVLRGSVQNALLNLQSLALTVEDNAEARELIALIRDELLRTGRLLLAAFEVVSLERARGERTELGVLARRALAAHGVEGVIVADGAWPRAVVDPPLLSLAIAHLARNARAATPAGRRAPEVTATAADGTVEIVVRDWGRGFGAVEPPGRAFASGRPGHAATGLLAAERVARLHGGRLTFRSSARGTTVRLSLPARAESVRRTAGARVARGGARPRARRRRAGTA